MRAVVMGDRGICAGLLWYPITEERSNEQVVTGFGNETIVIESCVERKIVNHYLLPWIPFRCQKFCQIFQIPHHIKSLDAYMKH
jgi:hypothetical protein